MTLTVAIGLAAGTLTTVAFLPQAVRTWRRKSAGDISLVTFSIFSTGVFLWLVYGLAIGDVPIILANAVVFPVAMSVLILTIRYRGQ